MINVIYDKDMDGSYGVWLAAENGHRHWLLAAHKREKTALALARRALVNAIMAVEQKERKLK